MTVWDVVAACRRRWYAVLVGLALTAVALTGLTRVDGVYVARVDVVFLAPATPATPNRIASAATGVIATAGLVERMVDPGPSGGAEPASTSAAVSLLGRGVRDGAAVVLPDSGGQWAQSFERPVLRIEVTGSSAAAVQAQAWALVTEVRDTTAALQADPRIAADNEITTSLVPGSPQVTYREGHRAVALAVTLLLGAAGTVVAAGALDGRLARVRRSRSPR